MEVVVKKLKQRLPWNRIPTTPRVIHINDSECNKHNKFCDNYVSTAKYNLVTFIPQNLFEQFMRVANIYFLVVSLLQLFSGLSPTGRVGTIVPLTFVVIFQMIKDGFEDMKRHIADRQVNKSLARVIRNGILQKVQWQEVVVGDIVRVDQDEYFPADLVCLTSSEPGGLCYIETSQLDGETNLKIRRSLPATANDSTVENLSLLRATITCQPPNNQLYKFVGKMNIEEEERDVPIEVEQILLRGAKLKNTRYIYGVSIYTGRHSKLMMNSEDAPHKLSKVEKVTNYCILGLFCIQIFMSVLCSFGIGIWQTLHINMWYLYFNNPISSAALGIQGMITFFILFNNFIPISLYVTMEFVKLLQARWMIDQDADMYYALADMPAVAKTSSLNEELGQVEYIFSDKTGTLTQNVMEFLKFSVSRTIYGRGTTEIGRAIAERNGVDLHDDRPANWKPSIEGFNFYDERILEGKWKEERHAQDIRRFLTLLAVCHTVIPESDKSDSSKIEYQAASPDEAALVKAAANLGFVFLERTPNSITIDASGEKESYELLNVLEFNSTRKRMSVIVRTPEGRIVLMTKGADNVIYKLMKPNKHSDITLEHLRKFAEEGLRTLVCAQVELDPQHYQQWNKNVFEKANTSLENKEDAVAQAAELIEKDLELVGATAIEDKLQEGIPATISELSKTGIKMWVLTGDKQETAINIGYACALLDNSMGIIILNDTNRSHLKAKIRNDLRMAENGEIMGNGLAIVIDGGSLDLVLQNSNISKEHAHEPTVEEKHHKLDDSHDIDLEGEEPLAVTFLKLCMLCKSVICCRVSPLQKALVVKLVKSNLPDAITLAIGDGANDVSMIQAAHIGIGISGQEGLQAARASDYAIGQFRYLKKLLLVHGRYNYRRIARLICYSFYKNITLQCCQFWYVWFNAFTGTTIYDPFLLVLFNIIFSSLPIVAFALFDRDVSVKASMEIPQLYAFGQRNYYLNMKVFFGWILNGMWHSIVCFFIPCITLYSTSMLRSGVPADMLTLSYIVYSCVVVIITLKVGVESATWTWAHFLAFFASIASWFIVVMLYAILWPLVSRVIEPNAPIGLLELRNLARHSYFEFFNVSYNGIFWFSILLAVVVALIRDVAWKSIVHNVTYGDKLRQVYHIIQDIEQCNQVVTEDTVRKRYPKLSSLKPPVRKLRTGVYLSSPLNEIFRYQSDNTDNTELKQRRMSLEHDHTGFSFSQTEGGQADLLRQATLKEISSPYHARLRSYKSSSAIHDDDDETNDVKSPLMHNFE